MIVVKEKREEEKQKKEVVGSLTFNLVLILQHSKSNEQNSEEKPNITNKKEFEGIYLTTS